jgi:hypothetical protein
LIHEDNYLESVKTDILNIIITKTNNFINEVKKDMIKNGKNINFTEEKYDVKSIPKERVMLMNEVMNNSEFQNYLKLNESSDFYKVLPYSQFNYIMNNWAFYFFQKKGKNNFH